MIGFAPLIISYEVPCAAQGDQPHCGFPEAKYLDCVERLVRHGLRVVVVEQTETPEMLKQRNDTRTPGTKKVSESIAAIQNSLLAGYRTSQDHPARCNTTVIVAHQGLCPLQAV